MQRIRQLIRQIESGESVELKELRGALGPPLWQSLRDELNKQTRQIERSIGSGRIAHRHDVGDALFMHREPHQPTIREQRVVDVAGLCNRFDGRFGGCFFRWVRGAHVLVVFLLSVSSEGGLQNHPARCLRRACISAMKRCAPRPSARSRDQTQSTNRLVPLLMFSTGISISRPA